MDAAIVTLDGTLLRQGAVEIEYLTEADLESVANEAAASDESECPSLWCCSKLGGS